MEFARRRDPSLLDYSQCEVAKYRRLKKSEGPEVSLLCLFDLDSCLNDLLHLRNEKGENLKSGSGRDPSRRLPYTSASRVLEEVSHRLLSRGGRGSKRDSRGWNY